jgi:hypothetical protein
MRLQHYLINELFDTDVPIKIEKESKDVCSYYFDIEDIPYNFLALKNAVGEKWSVAFFQATDKIGTSDITGVGNAPQVFSAVKKCFEKFTKKSKPQMFMFSAKEPSRKKLYDRMAKLVPKFIPYKFKGSRFSMGETVYDFERK